MDDLYPKGMSEELASRLYGSVTVPWASKPFTFDPDRSECQFWLGQNDGPGMIDYQQGLWPALVNVIRRGEGEGDDVRVFQWSNGLVYEQET